MMRAEHPRRAVIEAMAAEGYRKRYPDGRPRGKPPANVEATLFLLGAKIRVLPYRGRGYELGFVSFEDGLRLTQAKVAIDVFAEGDPTPETAKEYLQAMRTIVRMAPRYLLPVERVRRLFWRLGLRRNPFRKATDVEVGQLLGFFLGCRTRSRVQYPPPADARDLVPTS